MDKSKNKISLKTDDLCVLSDEQMAEAQGGSSWVCATVGITVDVAMWAYDKLKGKQKEEKEEESSKICVEGVCELEPAYCYSYAN